MHMWVMKYSVCLGSIAKNIAVFAYMTCLCLLIHEVRDTIKHILQRFMFANYVV